MTTELKPCPACGEPAHFIDTEEWLTRAHCTDTDCYMAGPAHDDDGAKWNALPRVPQTTDRDAEIESLAERLYIQGGYSIVGLPQTFDDAEDFIKCRDEWRAKRRQGE